MPRLQHKASNDIAVAARRMSINQVVSSIPDPKEEERKRKAVSVCVVCESRGIISDSLSLIPVSQAVAKKERRKKSIERLFVTPGARECIDGVVKAAIEDLQKEEDEGQEHTPVSKLQVREREFSSRNSFYSISYLTKDVFYGICISRLGHYFHRLVGYKLCEARVSCNFLLFNSPPSLLAFVTYCYTLSGCVYCVKAILTKAKEMESAERLFEYFVPDNHRDGLISHEAFSNAMKSISPEFMQVLN